MSIYEAPRRDFSIADGARPSIGDGIGAAFRLADQETDGNRRLDRAIYRDARQALMPMLFGNGQERVEFSPELRATLGDTGVRPDADTLGLVVQELEAMGREVPEGLRPEAFLERETTVLDMVREQREPDRELLERAGPGARVFSELVGGLGAAAVDPVNLATIPFGAPARVGILGQMLIEGGINAAIEAGQTPVRNAFLERLGEPEQNIFANAGIGFVFGAGIPLALRGVEASSEPLTRMTVAGARRVGNLLPRAERRAMVEAAEQFGDAESAAVAGIVRRDLEDEEAGAGPVDTREARLEHESRAGEARRAAEEGGVPEIPDRPLYASPTPSILGGAIEEVNPRDLIVQPDVFQFRSNVVAEGGQTERLLTVTEWRPERAGVVIVYEYADGSRAIADGHQRTGLARRIMDQTGQEIRVAAHVIREIDGVTPEQAMVEAALKNIAEAADGMSVAMARDAARILRVDPSRIGELPSGPEIRRAEALSSLSDDAFAMYINEVVPERFAELVGRLVNSPSMHAPIMQLLERTGPATTTQAESIIRQALETPVVRETTMDLFGEQEVVESLFIERAKVLDRAMQIMRQDRSVFRTLDEQAARIEGTGENRLDQRTNREIRQQTDVALAAVQALAHRAGPISEALNRGAQTYRENGRLKDAATSVVEAVRGAIERGGLEGLGAGNARPDAEPPRARTDAPDPNAGFADPLTGPAVEAQIQATRIAPDEVRIDDLTQMDPAAADVLEAQLKQAQAFRDLDDLFERGARNHAELDGEIAAAAAEIGVTQKRAPLKGRERTEAKVNGKYGGDVNRITDVARGGVDVPTPQAADAFVRRLARRYRVIDEGWNFTEAGYFDRKLTVVFDDGMLGEVQIWPPGLLDAKEARGGHKLYEISRDMTRPEAERADATDKMLALYGSVRDELPADWAAMLGGGSPPRASTEAMNRSSDTSGDRSSESTSAGSSSDQDISSMSPNMEPGSGSTAGIDPSTMKNRIASPSRMATEETAAGEQGLFDGVDPITDLDRMAERAAEALDGGTRGSDTEIGGLFDPADPSRVDLFDMVPVGIDEVDGAPVSRTMTREELAAELDADDEMIAALDACMMGVNR